MTKALSYDLGCGRVSVHRYFLHVCVYIYIHTHTYICIYTQIYVYTHMYVYIHTCTCIYAHVCMYMKRAHTCLFFLHVEGTGLSGKAGMLRCYVTKSKALA